MSSQSQPNLPIEETRSSRTLGIYSLLPHIPFLNEQALLKEYERLFGIDGNQTSEKAMAAIKHHILGTNTGSEYWGEGATIGRRVEILTNALFRIVPHEKRNMSPSIRESILEIPGLPEDLRGSTVYQMTDLHVNSRSAFFNPYMLEDLVTNLNGEIAKDPAERPSIVIFTGDLFSDYQDRFDIKLLEQTKHALKGIQTQHKFAVLGNHDISTGGEFIKALLEECGFTVLEDAAAIPMGIGSHKLQFTGVRSVADSHLDSSKVLSRTPEPGTIQIHLAHEPLSIVDTQRHTGHAIKAVFTGHTHGGNRGMVEKSRKVMERLSAVATGRDLKTTDLVERIGPSRAAFGEKANDTPFSMGIFRSQSGGNIHVIHPGVGQIYSPQRVVPSMVSKFVLRDAT